MPRVLAPLLLAFAFPFLVSSPVISAPPAPSAALVAAPDAPSFADTLLVTGLENALATGDGNRLASLARPRLVPQPGAASAAVNTVLARAWLFLGDPACALHFALAACRDSQDVTPRWLAAELYYKCGDLRSGDDLASALKERDPSSPVVPYLAARRILARLADTDADFNHPLIAVGSKNDPLLDLSACASACTSACTSAQARAHPDFDPRFFSLGIDVSLQNLDYSLAASYAATLCQLRPRNAPLARLALALAFDTPSLRDNLLARDTLPAAETVRWRQYARLFDLAPPQDLPGLWLNLADTAKNDPALAPVYVHLIARAAALLPDSDSRFPVCADAYAQAALDARSTPHAFAALRLLAPHDTDTPAVRDRRIALASLAGRHDLAATLVIRETPAHAGDFAWLASHRAIVARHQTPGAYIGYLLTMEHLRPEDPEVLLFLARVYDYHTLPPALAYYDRVFALAPAKLRLSFKDWFAYRNLVEAAAQRGQPADALARFDATIERIHAASPADIPAAFFYADLLDRRALLSKSPADHAAADAALKNAQTLAPDIGDPFGALGRPRTITLTI